MSESLDIYGPEEDTAFMQSTDQLTPSQQHAADRCQSITMARKPRAGTDPRGFMALGDGRRKRTIPMLDSDGS